MAAPSISPSPSSAELADTAEAERELQERVARYARGLVAFTAILGLASVATHLWAPGVSNLGWLHNLTHFASIVPALAVWLRCRGAQMSYRGVQTTDAFLTVAVCSIYALMGVTAPASLSVVFSLVLALTYTLLGRSILVPSSYRRTLLISALAALPVILYLLKEGAVAVFGAPESAGIFVVFAIAWCVFAVIVASSYSRQLYGLRQKIREIRKLGQYVLEEKIGEGGMGVVYRATHAMLRRPAAIKLLSKERTSERDQHRFEREVQLTSRLAHPNTVSIFDYGRTADGVFYYVMEYLDGFDLDRLVNADGPLEPARALHVLTQVCGALGEAHALGLVHRDIKPANIVLSERVDAPDVVKVVDFGLARAIEKDTKHSRAGAILGTPLYLAPEAITHPESLDGRADLYALGAVGYFLLSGRNVFDGPSVVEVLSKHVLEAPKPPSAVLGRALPADLEDVLLRCLAKEPAARPRSAEELMTALLACEDARRYDKSAAFAWWRTRGATLRSKVGRTGSTSPRTMAIDFRSRNLSRAAGEVREELVLGSR
jgi:eukaryotic-like serine/threonine-protein kinase